MESTQRTERKVAPAVREEFDVIIAGASFGGLSVASRLQAKVLIIDKDPLGTHQRSACGTFTSVIESLGLHDAVLATSDRAVIHASGVPSYHLEDPLCTVDYGRFCYDLLERGSATFLQASVQGLAGSASAPEVITDRGTFRARYLVDASGWRAVLASALEPTLVDRSALSFGLETDARYPADQFYFWLDRNTMEDGVAWVFPAGKRSRVGLASYRGETVKAQMVREFLRTTGADPSAFHGGFFPNKLRRPTVGDIFLVGDSAGQCLPLTGEGIRPALYFGQKCGDLLQSVIDGERSLRHALRDYRRDVERFRWPYKFLALAQRIAPRLPRLPLKGLLRFLEVPAVGRWCLRRYISMMPLQPLRPAAAPLAAPGPVTGERTVRTSATHAYKRRRDMPDKYIRAPAGTRDATESTRGNRLAGPKERRQGITQG